MPSACRSRRPTPSPGSTLHRGRRTAARTRRRRRSPGTCTDKAGNMSSGSFALRTTRPRRAADGAPAGRRCEWLVQPRAHDLVRRSSPGDRRGSSRAARRSSYTGPDSADASRSRHVHRPGGEHEPWPRLRLQVRRHGAAALPRRTGRRTRTVGTSSSLTISFTQPAGDLSGPDSCTAAVDLLRARRRLGDAVAGPAPTGPGTSIRLRRA